VFPQELTRITPADREYLAKEMMAFLVSWFLTMKCPVINRPTPVCLTGPAWRVEQWTYAAAQIGIPVEKAQRHVVMGSDNFEPPSPASSTTVTVVGHRCFGDVEEKLCERSVKLAKAAGVTLLNISYSGPEANSCFIGADLIPRLEGETEEAVLQLLLTEEAVAV